MGLKRADARTLRDLPFSDYSRNILYENPCDIEALK
jgi:hypothetical protein